MPAMSTMRTAAGNTLCGPVPLSVLPAGRYVQVTVADEGCGISPADLPHVFDPFFTTKPSGSGLGLSSSYSIMARHGGRIAAESTPGRGSVFTLYLPASQGQPLAAVARQALPGQGRVLLMDDDDTIRVVAQRMLEHLGYEAEVSSHGDEALALCAQALREGRPHDAVILDLTIPGREGGAQVLGHLRALQPALTAIVASGYADDDVLAHPEAHGFQGRLHKPFDLTALSVELTRVLRAARG